VEGFDDLDDMQDSMDNEKGEGAPHFLVHRGSIDRGTKSVSMNHEICELDPYQSPDVITQLYQLEKLKREVVFCIEVAQDMGSEQKIQGTGLCQDIARGMEAESERDSSQEKRWEEFIAVDHANQMECDFNLLKAMELLEDEGQVTLGGAQDLDVLGEDIVDRIIETRGSSLQMGACENTKKNRRRQGAAGTVMERAMELKKRKIWSP
jgi:hypothetical protein